MADPVVAAAYSPLDYLKKPYKLLRQGADIAITDEDGNGAFHYLVQSDLYKDPVPPECEEEFIFPRGSRPPLPIEPPAPVDDPSMTMKWLVHSLQAAGADINLQNKNGETPLHLLCRNYSCNQKLASRDRERDERLLQTMCQAGADLDITRDRQGRSAVFFLCHIRTHSRYSGQEALWAGLSLPGASLSFARLPTKGNCNPTLVLLRLQRHLPMSSSHHGTRGLANENMHFAKQEVDGLDGSSPRFGEFLSP